MVKFFLLLTTVISCKELENLRLQNKQLSNKNVRLTVSYIGSDNCRRYLKKKGRSEKYIEAVVARNEKFGRYTTHLLGGENGDFAGINNRGLAFSGDKFFTDEDRGIPATGVRSTITQMSAGDSKTAKQLLTMRTIEANCRRLLVNIYSPGHRPKVLVYPGTIIYPDQPQRFQEDFGNDFGKIDCGNNGHPCSFAEIKGWYFLYVMPDVDNFVKLAISEHNAKDEPLNVFGLVGYLLDGQDDYGKLHLRITKTSLQEQISDLSATSLEVRVNCQDKNWREAKVYYVNDLRGNYTSLKINTRDLIEYFSARKFARLGQRHDCYRPGQDPRSSHDLWLFWQVIHLQFSFVVLGQPPQVYRYSFDSNKQWSNWLEGRGTITATTTDGKKLSVLLTAP